MIKSLFEAEGIEYFVQNDHFGVLTGAPSVGSYRDKVIYVPEEFFQTARDLLADSLPEPEQPDENWKSEYSLWDRLKMAIEAFLFGGLIPPQRKKEAMKPQNTQGRRAQDGAHAKYPGSWHLLQCWES